MIIHRADRTDDLLDDLAALLDAPLAGRDAIEPEWLIVQSRAMERWLTQGLATRLGIVANARFPFPAQAIDDLLRGLGLAPHTRLRFGPRRLTWAVARRLVEPIDPALGPLAAYLAGDPDRRGRLPLARRVAEVLDDYVAHRPDMVLAWQAGDDDYASRHGVPWSDGDAWQPALWRMLVADLEDAHLATLAGRLAARLDDAAPTPTLPARLCVFAPTTLPPLHVRLFRELSRRIEVHAFVATPSPARWAEVARWLDGAAGPSDADGAPEHPPPASHPLVAANNHVAEDLQRLLHGDRADQVDREAGRRVASTPRAGIAADGAGPVARTVQGAVAASRPPTAPTTLLEALQTDIRSDARRGADDRPRWPWDPRDASIELHACHGPQREVEVLRDRLLAALADDPTLRPDDILVMAPDMAAYAPYVSAVFGVPSEAPGFIPFRIADRGIATESAVFGALEAVLDVLDGRFGASTVLDLLALAPVAERFGLGADAPESLRRWVDDAAIRWAVDGSHRTTFALPEDAANTWREGIDRLLLGWAMPDDGPPWAGALPRGSFGAADAELLGRVAEAIDVLDGLRARVDGQRTMAGWAAALDDVLKATVSETWRNAEEHAAVRQALGDLKRHAADGGYEAPLPLGVVRGLLTGRLGEDDGARAFLTGALTFCALLPLRSVPHRVVALLGMSDDAFPRADHAAGFDLIARAPRIGDRNQRRADRQLFLEALMAARARLIITWIGRGMADDAERPPSVVVAELLDTLGGMLALDDEAVGERLVAEHPRQPFSPRNFDPSNARLASFAAGFVPPSTVAETAPPFVRGPIGPPADDSRTDGAPESMPGGMPGGPDTVTDAGPLELDALVRFLQSPCQAFIRQRLGLYLEPLGEAAADREPLVLDGLEAWALGARLLADAAGEHDLGAAKARERASGQLPPGVLGELAFAEVAAKAARVHEAFTGPGEASTPGEARNIDVLVGGQRLIGQVDGASPEGFDAAQFGSIKARHMLALWVRHLALCAAADAAGDGPQRSRLVGKEGEAIAFGHVERAAEILADLVAWWRRGQALPLPLLPDGSAAYAKAMLAEKGERAARRAAESAWNPPSWGTGRGDGDDPYIRQVFGGINPFGPDVRPEELPALAAPFEAVALAVWAPLMAAADAAGGGA